MESICYLFDCKYNISAVCTEELGELGIIAADESLLRLMMKYRRTPDKECYEMNIEQAEYEVEE